MSGSRRQKVKRNLRVRGIFAGVLLLAALAVFILLGMELRGGMTTSAWLYGLAVITLFAATGTTAGPVLKYWQKNKEKAG